MGGGGAVYVVFHALLGLAVLGLGGWLGARAFARGLIGKELRHTFASPIAWLVMAGFTFVNGFIFAFIADHYAGFDVTQPLPVLLFGNLFFWISQFVIVPAITMRLIAEERASGTLETLMTAPVTDGEVVFAKWLAALVFYMVLWMTTAVHLGIAYWYGAPDDFAKNVTSVATFFSQLNAVMDLGPIAAAYAGILLMGSAWLAIGVLMSALARDQVVAFILAFAVTIISFVIHHARGLLPDAPGWVGRALEVVSFQLAFEPFPRGAIDSRPVVYLVSLTVVALFLAVRVVESRKWR